MMQTIDASSPQANSAAPARPEPVAVVTKAFTACGWPKAAYDIGEPIGDPHFAELAIAAGKARPVTPAAQRTRPQARRQPTEAGS